MPTPASQAQARLDDAGPGPQGPAPPTAAALQLMRLAICLAAYDPGTALEVAGFEPTEAHRVAEAKARFPDLAAGRLAAVHQLGGLAAAQLLVTVLTMAPTLSGHAAAGALKQVIAALQGLTAGGSGVYSQIDVQIPSLD